MYIEVFGQINRCIRCHWRLLRSIILWEIWFRSWEFNSCPFNGSLLLSSSIFLSNGLWLRTLGSYFTCWRTDKLDGSCWLLLIRVFGRLGLLACHKGDFSCLAVLLWEGFIQRRFGFIDALGCFRNRIILIKRSLVLWLLARILSAACGCASFLEFSTADKGDLSLLTFDFVVGRLFGSSWRAIFEESNFGCGLLLCTVIFSSRAWFFVSTSLSCLTWRLLCRSILKKQDLSSFELFLRFSLFALVGSFDWGWSVIGWFSRFFGKKGILDWLPSTLFPLSRCFGSCALVSFAQISSYSSSSSSGFYFLILNFFSVW